MKKQLLTLAALGLLLQVNAQSIKESMQGERGLSAHFTTLTQTQQVRFNPAQARVAFSLDPKSDLVIKNTESDKIGMLHYRYYQTYSGIPVENAMYIVHTKNGMLTGMSGSIITDFDPAMSSRMAAKLSNAQAISAALNFVNAQKYAWQDPAMEQRIIMRTGDPNASYYPKPTQVWYNAGDEIDARALRVAYKVDVYTIKPFNRQFVFVDAQTGKILGTKAEMEGTDATGTAATAYSGTQTIHSDLSGSSYRLRDLTKGNGIITLHAASGHADYTNSTPNWALTGANQYALDAHFGVAATWTYYKNNFNRNSVDNAGFALTSWVNDANNTDNADWDGSEMDYGNLSSNGAGVTAIDVTGHELTHGVTQFTCNLVYSGESGAMNESMSDCMGKSVQFYTKPSDNSWILSNDMNWEIRSFPNPNADGQPDTYKGTDWYSGSADNGGVHTNSGVGNFAFYLLVTGGSGTNDIGSVYSVSGIGLTEADQIVYRTETVYLTTTSKYADWRTAYINAATDLYGASSNEVNQCMNAWYAVGIGTAGGNGCGIPAGLSSSLVTSNSATVSWGTVTGATSYNVQYKVSTSPTWTTVTGITGTSTGLTGLISGTTYNYQVAAVCSGGTSAYSTASSFTTTGTAPCNTPTGEATGSITGTSAIFSWTAVSGAVSYNIQYRVIGASSWTPATSGTASYSATGLTLNTNYEWQVQTACTGGGTSSFSASTNFTTTGLTYCTSVGKTLDGITNVTFNTINNTTSGTTSGYTNYSGTISTTVNQGQAYTLSVKINTGGNYTNYTKAWIDWNHDGTFSTTTEEYNLGTATNVTNGTTTLSPLSITVPATAVVGSTRMRVSTEYNTNPAPCTASFDGEVEDYGVVVATGAVCNAPTGMATGSIGNNSATFSWTAVTGAASYNVQYRQTGTTTWSTANTLTASYAASGLTTATTYEWQVQTVCSGGGTSSFTASTNFTTTGSVTYCTSTGNTTYEYINNVNLGSINNTSGNNSGYGNYTSLSTNLSAGVSNTIKLTPGFTGTKYAEYWTVYIDYNHDGVLNGTGEIVAQAHSLSTGAAISASFTVPATAKNGTTRMRVQMHYNSYSTNPCGALDFGEVEDYTVNITGGTFSSFASNPPAAMPDIMIAPNPVADAVSNAIYHLASNGNITIRVVDMYGRVLQNINLGNQSAGAHTYVISDLNQLASGNYVLLLVEDNLLVARGRFIVAK